MKGRKADCPKSVIHPPLGFRRGVSHTPIKRPDRGERLSDGRVPVGRMRVRPTGIGLSAFGVRRGVSHTPPKRPDRGERSFDGRVPVGRMRYAPTSGGIPVGRMRYAPTSGGIPASSFRRGEKFFAPTPVRKAHCNPATALTFWGKQISGWRQCLLFGGSKFPAGDGTYFLGEADFRAATALTFWGKQISGWRRRLLFGGRWSIARQSPLIIDH